MCCVVSQVSRPCRYSVLHAVLHHCNFFVCGCECVFLYFIYFLFLLLLIKIFKSATRNSLFGCLTTPCWLNLGKIKSSCILFPFIQHALFSVAGCVLHLQFFVSMKFKYSTLVQLSIVTSCASIFIKRDYLVNSFCIFSPCTCWS